MSESIKCFKYLSENIPQWIVALEELEKRIKARQDQISRVPVPARTLKKTGSSESIRPRSGHGVDAMEVISAPQGEDMIHPIDGEGQSPGKRKRKTTSLMSNISVPAKYRSRSMIIVYYDSDIQKRFEEAVKNIGTGRNHIRRARTAHRMEAITKGDAASYLRGSRMAQSTPAILETTSGQTPGVANGSDNPAGIDVFGTTDAALEKAQSLCERGAHQFLREGDCEAEILGARESFEETKRLSDKELSRLEEEAANNPVPEADGVHEDDNKPQHANDGYRLEIAKPIDDVLVADGAIEADDDDAMDDSYDAMAVMATFRARRLMGRS